MIFYGKKCNFNVVYSRIYKKITGTKDMSLNQEKYRKLISGQTKGLAAATLRIMLRIAAVGYGLIIEFRNLLYNKGFLKSHRTRAIVISIGNITTGGTGKTPLVAWICNYLTQNYKCAILTRGYKTHTNQRNTKYEIRDTSIDEPEILRQNCPQADVIVNPDRIAGAAEAIEKYNTKVLIMDDGFQHRRLARDLDIITIDATEPFGYDKLLPAGLLREPLASLRRADVVVITRCDQINTNQIEAIEQRIRQIKSDLLIARSSHSPVCTKTLQNQIGLEQLQGKKVFAFCGIGNPDAFLDTIRKMDCILVGSKIYDDHYHYARNDIIDIYNQAQSLNADLILTTQKDWSSAKYEISDTKYNNFAYIEIEIIFRNGLEKLTDLIEKTLAVKI
jgi:tetraacyldisaccharide 4'-kinase